MTTGQKTRGFVGRHQAKSGVFVLAMAVAGGCAKSSPVAEQKDKIGNIEGGSSRYGAAEAAPPMATRYVPGPISPPPPADAQATNGPSAVAPKMKPGAKGDMGGGCTPSSFDYPSCLQHRGSAPVGPMKIDSTPGAGNPFNTGNGGAIAKAPDGLVAPAVVPIDSNGRFATTYRPGAGHLAAFESAIARGIVPEADRDVVGDVGARYAPDMAAPKDKSLAVLNELERGKLPPTGGITNLRVSLRSTDKAPSGRPHISMHLVLDISGSMAGASIENARTAAAALVDKLGAGDDFSLTTFSTDAQLVVPDGPVGTRRAAIKKTIGDIKEGGGTNIGAGLAFGYTQAQTKTIPSDAVRVVLLVSDGKVNAGIVSQSSLSKMALDAFQNGIQTSTFGLGAEYDGPLMSSIAGDGAGGYYYLRDADQIAPALATELDKRVDPVATAVEVRIRLKKGIELLDAYGSRRLDPAQAERVRQQEIAIDAQEDKKNGIKKDRENDENGGMRFFIPAFARDEAHGMLFQIRVPEGVGDRDIALVELKYKDRVTKKNVQDELVVKTSYASSDEESAGTVNASVAKSVQGFSAGETLMAAATQLEAGNRDGAGALLAEREGILRQAAESLSEPLFIKDADRLARLRTHCGEEYGVGDPLVLAMLLETAGSSHLR